VARRAVTKDIVELRHSHQAEGVVSGKPRRSPLHAESGQATGWVPNFHNFAKRLYRGRGQRARTFLYALLIFDALSLFFIVAISFCPGPN
jgi:hypothetical protein